MSTNRSKPGKERLPKSTDSEAALLGTQPKQFVFTLMPFDQDFDDVYSLGIKPACVDAGAYCERVDEQIFHESILQRIYNQIAKADLIIADMTGRNPNVFYEVGYAHALGKPVVLLTRNVDDIPFDLQHYPHIVYGGSIATLKSELLRRVSWCLSEKRRDSRAPTLDGLRFYVGGAAISPGEVVVITGAEIDSTFWDGSGLRGFNINFSMKNISRSSIDLRKLKFSVATPNITHFTDRRRERQTRLPDGRLLIHVLPGCDFIRPDEWLSDTIPILAAEVVFEDLRCFDCYLEIIGMDSPLVIQFEITNPYFGVPPRKK